MTPEEKLSLDRGRFTYENEQAEKRAVAASAVPGAEEDPAVEEEKTARASFPKGKQAGG